MKSIKLLMEKEFMEKNLRKEKHEKLIFKIRLSCFYNEFSPVTSWLIFCFLFLKKQEQTISVNVCKGSIIPILTPCR